MSGHHCLTVSCLFTLFLLYSITKMANNHLFLAVLETLLIIHLSFLYYKTDSIISL